MTNLNICIHSRSEMLKYVEMMIAMIHDMISQDIEVM